MLYILAEFSCMMLHSLSHTGQLDNVGENGYAANFVPNPYLMVMGFTITQE
jgi:hypothetical protein